MVKVQQDMKTYYTDDEIIISHLLIHIVIL